MTIRNWFRVFIRCPDGIPPTYEFAYGCDDENYAILQAQQIEREHPTWDVMIRKYHFQSATEFISKKIYHSLAFIRRRDKQIEEMMG